MTVPEAKGSVRAVFALRPILITGWLCAATAALAAEPFTSATVSRVENQVSYGKVVGDRSETRPAAANDVVKAANFLMSEAESRAELKYEDGTIVRIGQNTIFTFEANTRTLNLKKGTFVFYVPKGKGGGTIKTPSFTAAITGTIGKVADNLIAVIEGEVTLVPSGRKVSEGFFARFNSDGSIDILPFDRMKEFHGKLMTFNGPLPGIPESAFGSLTSYFSGLGVFTDEPFNMPSQIKGPDAPPPTPKKADKPTPTPTPVPTPVPTSSPSRGGGGESPL